MTAAEQQAVHEQRMAALHHAQERRMEIVRLRREITALPAEQAWEHVAQLLEDRDPRIERITVRKLLRSIRYMGEIKVAELCRWSSIPSQDWRIGRLTDRQRHLLCLSLRTGGQSPSRRARIRARRRAEAA